MASTFILYLKKERLKFITQTAIISAALILPFYLTGYSNYKQMKETNQFDVIIAGGSYLGLAAAMTLGRALRKVLVLDNGRPCNRHTPHSHNFITQDGKTPNEITALAKQQVSKYDTVQLFTGRAVTARNTTTGFEIQTEAGEVFTSRKIIFATGIKDIMPDIPGFSECWGTTIIHCPYCHGYEVRHQKTGILGNGAYGFEFSSLISNWTNDLTLYTNGVSTLTPEQTAKLKRHNIHIVEDEIGKLEHENGNLRYIIFTNGKSTEAKALYTRVPFVQHCAIPRSLGCELNSDGYIKVDPSQKTSVHGVFACGDNTSRIRTVANAVAMGTTAGMMVNKEIIEENF